MNLLMEVAAAGGRHFPVAFIAVYVVGFIAAVSIGSIAWYNSKRPAGWEGQQRPDYIPEVNLSENEQEQSNKS